MHLLPSKTYKICDNQLVDFYLKAASGEEERGHYTIQKTLFHEFFF